NKTEVLTGEFYLNYGAACEEAGNVEKAAELFKKSIEIDPGNAAQAYNYLGYMWIDRGENLDEAGELIKRALELDPDNAAFIDSMGWYYFKKGQYDKALAELLRAASSIEPTEAGEVYDHVGDTYARLGDT